MITSLTRAVQAQIKASADAVGNRLERAARIGAIIGGLYGGMLAVVLVCLGYLMGKA